MHLHNLMSCCKLLWQYVLYVVLLCYISVLVLKAQAIFNNVFKTEWQQFFQLHVCKGTESTWHVEQTVGNRLRRS